MENNRDVRNAFDMQMHPILFNARGARTLARHARFSCAMQFVYHRKNAQLMCCVEWKGRYFVFSANMQYIYCIGWDSNETNGAHLLTLDEWTAWSHHMIRMGNIKKQHKVHPSLLCLSHAAAIKIAIFYVPHIHTQRAGCRFSSLLQQMLIAQRSHISSVPSLVT